MAVGKKTGGRQKGTPNRLTAQVKEAILEAFDAAGGVEYLTRVAKEDPRTFCALLGRVLPSEMKVEGNIGFNIVDILNERIRRIENGQADSVARH